MASSYLLKFINENKFDITKSASSVSGREKQPTWRPLVTCGCVCGGIEEDGIFAQFLAKGKTKKKKLVLFFFVYR